MEIRFLFLVVVVLSFARVEAQPNSVTNRPKTTATDRENRSADSNATRPNTKHERLREGTRIENQFGRFEVTGDRVTFYSASGSDSIRVLENLALERVTRELTGIARNRQWKITAIVTEFKGNNFLLLEHAVLRTDTTQ